MEITALKNPSRKPYIYKVTNLETGQYYIGSQCIGKIIGHNYFTSSTNKNFQDDFKNYREEKYKIEIIKEFEDPDECGRVENYMIRDHMQLKDGLCLNRACCCGGKRVFSRVGIPSPKKGIPRSEETKQKISRSQKGRPAWNKGFRPSEETKQKISRSQKGRPAWNKGFRPSEETRKKLSEANKGHPAWNKGAHHSEEAKQKMSEAHKGIPSPRRIKISIDGIVFDSITEASKYYNVAIETIRKWIKKNQHNAFYVK